MLLGRVPVIEYMSAEREMDVMMPLVQPTPYQEHLVEMAPHDHPTCVVDIAVVEIKSQSTASSIPEYICEPPCESLSA